MAQTWKDVSLEISPVPDSLAKIISEQELDFSAWMADWLVTPQNWSAHWTKPDNIYRATPSEGIEGFMLEVEGNGTHSLYELTEGVDRFNGSSADESVYGLGSNDWLRGNDGRDLLDGGDGNDTLEGGSGNDWLTGGEGDDVMAGGSGSDLVDGGGGHDEISANAYDRIDGGTGRDRLYTDYGTSDAFVDLADGIAHAAGLGTARIANMEDISAGAGNDQLLGNGSENRIWGNSGDDMLAGRGGDDMLDGGTGFDRLFGGTGDDRLSDGEDMTGGAGRDSFAIGLNGLFVIRDFEAGLDKLELGTGGATELAGSLDDMLAAAEAVPGGLLVRLNFVFDGDEFHTSTVFFQSLSPGGLSVADFVA